MPSEPPEDRATTPQSQSKSKQERIRDNQRRSRARRQEYLADLEKRLSECQITCRDADIQRAAFIELQIENTRLRELLSLAGVNDQFVEHYVSQAVAQASQFPQEANPTLRQLKPKIATMDPTRVLSNASTSNPILQQQQSNIASAPSRRHSHTVMSSTSGSSVAERNIAPTSASSYNPISPFIPPMTEISSPTTFDWLYQPSPLPQARNPSDPFLCEHFGLAAQGIPRTTDDNTVLCSVAKQMIDQYHIPPHEMEKVKSKLSSGFCQPSYPGSGCSVDNQILFQVLNELSTKYA